MVNLTGFGLAVGGFAQGFGAGRRLRNERDDKKKADAFDVVDRTIKAGKEIKDESKRAEFFDKEKGNIEKLGVEVASDFYSAMTSVTNNNAKASKEFNVAYNKAFDSLRIVQGLRRQEGSSEGFTSPDQQQLKEEHISEFITKMNVMNSLATTPLDKEKLGFVTSFMKRELNIESEIDLENIATRRKKKKLFEENKQLDNMFNQYKNEHEQLERVKVQDPSLIDQGDLDEGERRQEFRLANMLAFAETLSPESLGNTKRRINGIDPNFLSKVKSSPSFFKFGRVLTAVNTTKAGILAATNNDPEIAKITKGMEQTQPPTRTIKRKILSHQFVEILRSKDGFSSEIERLGILNSYGKRLEKLGVSDLEQSIADAEKILGRKITNDEKGAFLGTTAKAPSAKAIKLSREATGAKKETAANKRLDALKKSLKGEQKAIVSQMIELTESATNSEQLADLMKEKARTVGMEGLTPQAVDKVLNQNLPDEQIRENLLTLLARQLESNLQSQFVINNPKAAAAQARQQVLSEKDEAALKTALKSDQVILKHRAKIIEWQGKFKNGLISREVMDDNIRANVDAINKRRNVMSKKKSIIGKQRRAVLGE